MSRSVVVPVLLCLPLWVNAQAGLDPLRSASDKAQEHINGVTSPRGGDARSVTGTDKVFTTVDQMPAVLEDTTIAVMPSPCRAMLPDTMDVSRPVVMRFIVERDGSLTAIEPLADPVLDQAARCELLRLHWAPGRQSGVPVRVRTSLMMSFSR